MNDAKKLKVVYELQKDLQYIENVQKATLETDDFGVEPTHRLYGSDEWWDNIESGVLPKHTALGKITRVYMGSMGDWPEFEMITDNGETLAWTREQNSPDLDALYTQGATVQVVYVIQQHRPKSWDSGAETKCVIEIRVENEP